jgi:peptide/nickel transport system substrate-binding protein
VNDEAKVTALYQAVLSGRVSRREVLRRATALGISASGVAALLAACGGGSSATNTPAASTSGGSTTPAGTAAAGTAGGATTAAKPAGKPGGEIVFGLNLEPDNLDPAVTPFAVSHEVMMNIYDTLVWRGKDGKFYPGLAERWETSADGITYTFYLRKGVKFHDGTPFTAEAIKVQFDRTADPATKSGFAANLLGPYDHTDIVDDFTAKVVFKAPFAPFLDGASQAFLGIASPTAVKKDPKAFLRNPVGTGFMKFVEWVEKDHITLARNPDYNWAPPFFDHTGAAYLDKITIRFYPDDPTRLASLESGDVQMIQSVPTSDVNRIKANTKYGLDVLYNPGIPTVLMMNTTKAPLDDPIVRQAFIQAIDRKTLVETGTFGTGRIAYGPLNESTPDYSKAVESYYPFDLEKAKGALQQAGWVPGSDGIRTKNGQKLSVSWIVAPSSAAYDELMQAQLRGLGVDVQLSRQTTAALFDAMVKGNIHMGLIGWVSSDPVILTNLFHSKNAASGYAWSKFKDPKLDGLLDDGERTLDEAKRVDTYAQAQKMIMDNALTVPLFSSANTYAYQSKYKSIKEDFRNYVWFYDAFVG